jgi:hypothetical protein
VWSSSSLTSGQLAIVGTRRSAHISYKFRSHLQKLGARIYIYIVNGNNIDVHLFTNAEAAIYTMESDLHGGNLKMLYNNMQKYRTVRIV